MNPMVQQTPLRQVQIAAHTPPALKAQRRQAQEGDVDSYSDMDFEQPNKEAPLANVDFN